MSLRLLLEASDIDRDGFTHHAGRRSAWVESDNHQNEQAARLNKLMEDRYVPRPKLSSVV